MRPAGAFGEVYAAYSQTVQESQERVPWLETAGFRPWWGGPTQRLFLDGEIGVEIDPGRVRRLVPQPQGDDGTIDAPAKEVDGSRVTQDMGRDPPFL